MFRNYLKIAWRNIKRQKIYSTINIVGLAVGLTISLVIAFYVIDDLTFDHFHENADSVYRVIMFSNVEGRSSRVSAITSVPCCLHPRMKYPRSSALLASSCLDDNPLHGGMQKVMRWMKRILSGH